MRTSLSKKFKIKLYFHKYKQLTNIFEYLANKDERSNVGDWAIQNKNHQLSFTKTPFQKKKNAQAIVASLRGLIAQSSCQQCNMHLLVLTNFHKTLKH